jgi:hypothetical protein
MEITKYSEEFQENIIFDLKKKDISLEEKSRFYNEYIKEHRISQREFGRRFNIPHSTVQDVCSLRQVGKEIVLSNKNFIVEEKHLTPSEKHKQDIRILQYNNKNLDTLIERVTYLLTKEFKRTDKTVKRLEDLREEVNKVLLNLK